MEGVEAGGDDDGDAGEHRQVGHVAEEDHAEHDRPEQRKVAKRRDEGDFAGAHGDDDALIADQHEHRGGEQDGKTFQRHRPPAAHRLRQQRAGDAAGDGGRQRHHQRRHFGAHLARGEVAGGGEESTENDGSGGKAKAFRAWPDDDQHADETHGDRRPAPPADRFAEKDGSP